MKTKNKILKNITPIAMRCAALGCPAIYEAKDGTYVIIGKLLKTGAVVSELENAISSGEVAIQIPKGLLSNLKD